MIASIKGKVLTKGPEGVVVDVRGVGYHIHVPLRSLGDIPDRGKEVFLHTYTNVREDAIQLFGFVTEEERRLFTTLIGINGIGPKLALTILSGMPVNRLIEAINNEDIEILTRIPGLGRKTVARLVLELRGKLPAVEVPAGGLRADLNDDAVSALVNLGYKRSDSQKAVRDAMKRGLSSIEDIIKEALRYLTEG